MPKPPATAHFLRAPSLIIPSSYSSSLRRTCTDATSVIQQGSADERTSTAFLRYRCCFCTADPALGIALRPSTSLSLTAVDLHGNHRVVAALVFMGRHEQDRRLYVRRRVDQKLVSGSRLAFGEKSRVFIDLGDGPLTFFSPSTGSVVARRVSSDLG
ncbi:hypothetical protein B0H11DRAFT_2272413 [Mycena galericulata]|nr:hypothetical protein B0H11DRAFT_2272413 [Mycena galericulata]